MDLEQTGPVDVEVRAYVYSLVSAVNDLPHLLVQGDC